MLSWIKGIFGLSSVGLIGGVLLAFAGAATWLREDGIQACTSRFEGEIAQAALKAHNEVAFKQLTIERLEKQLAMKERDADEKAKADQDALAKQASEFPLSAECLRCRVPNERIWLRSEQVAGKPKSSSGISKAPGS